MGCPLDKAYDANNPANRGDGWLFDDQRPTLTLTEPQPGANPALARILIGMHDYYSGLDKSSFTVTADFAVGHLPAGERLGSRFKQISPGVFELKLAEPITALPQSKLTVSVKDRQGNANRIERTFSVGKREK